MRTFGACGGGGGANAPRAPPPPPGYGPGTSFPWTIAFARRPIFNIVSFLTYLVFLRAVPCTEQPMFLEDMVFRMFLAFLIFDPN